MSLIDIIKNIINNGKQNAQIYCQTLQKTYQHKEPLEIGVYDNKKPLTDTNINITINSKTYQRKTDQDGIARLNINLPPNTYKATIDFENENYNHVTAYCDVIVKADTWMDGTNLTKNEGDPTPYQCAVYTIGNNQRIRDTVNITINGVKYTKTADNEGLYKLNINLNPGTYPLTASYEGSMIYNPSSITNTITVNPKPPEPEPEPEPQQLWDYITDQGPGELGQRTGYTCGPHSLMQCIYRLTGIELSEMELAGVCGTTSDGTGHDGLATGLAWFNRKYGYNLKMKWYNFSEIGFDGTQQAMDKGACFHHILYRNEWGHYEVPKWTGGNPIYVLNSLGNSCGGGYCGYIEERTRGEHQSYINGISQKSVCIITR